MGWAKYEEDIRITFEERVGMDANRYFCVSGKKSFIKEQYGRERNNVLYPETRIVKRHSN